MSSRPRRNAVDYGTPSGQPSLAIFLPRRDAVDYGRPPCQLVSGLTFSSGAPSGTPSSSTNYYETTNDFQIPPDLSRR
ncbi:hypothetical protein M407DRAFT_29665 [Tulasnella calospora MUT 4182]|uniref:Uncharacterized protein n=1 Tax=Tulasnella calospora MUT 4182 TaxID=1051891 RepID=A0A0C3Q8N3_9AGAM|nr:hypothetical protein M407DRAFT_29665 [Tulasnella calospora MUT 4182]